MPPLFCNDPVVGTFVCPDGSTYFFPIAGGVFCDLNLERANAIAQSTANNRAAANHFCLNAPCLSPCLNEASTFNIQIVGGTGPFIIDLWSGSIPAGMTVVAGARDIRLSGTPTVAGEQSFVLKISDGVGGYLITHARTLTVHVLQITPSTLPTFTAGAAYSQQLGVIGGSGNYAWKITAGSLPTGLTMSLSGLISGTPTSSVATAFSVQVIDLTCEQLNKTFFPPRVSLVGHSSHTIATILGYPEYIGSTPPKKYKNLTWEGTSEQTAFNVPPSLAGFVSGQVIPIALIPADPALVASAKYEWSGTGAIDDTGQQISRYQKLFSAMCQPNRNAFGPSGWPAIVPDPRQVFVAGALPIQVLKGYCSPLDANSCDVCSLTFQGDVADNSRFDLSDFVRLGGGPTITSTTWEERYGGTGLMLPLSEAVSELVVPPNFGMARPVIVSATHNYSATLSDEYTDAIALANALRFVSNGLVAENRPRTTGFVSSFTDVQFDLRFSNLVPGVDYVATVSLWSSTGAIAVRTYAFTASESTHVISDNAPTPAAQRTIVVRNATVRFA